jgi:tRNA uracil 4-sulfurtransferase
MASGDRCVTLKFGELALKKRNRGRFVDALVANLQRLTSDLPRVAVERRGGVLIARAEGEAAQAELERRCQDLIGLSVVQPAVRCERDAGAIAAASIELLRARSGATFAVRSRRRDKTFPLRSTELDWIVGDAIRRELGLRVDLDAPELEVTIEVDPREALVSAERLPAPGGLPVGSSGRALVLLSGGFDSPVAAHRMLRRGMRCDFVHFSGQPFTGPESLYKAYALASRLDRFQGASRLFVVPFGLAQRALATAGAGKLQVLSQRRLMVRVASELGRRERVDALVTGDSLGQVASQTVQNMSVVSDASELLVLRPLVAFDKSEIIAAARALGTFEISAMPDEDCCQLFASKLAVTRADARHLQRIERTADVAELVDGLVESAELLEPRHERTSVGPVLVGATG